MDPSILIILTGSLGDVARALPLATVIKKGFPRGRLGWVVERRWREIVALHPGVDRLLVFDRRRPAQSGLRLLTELRSDAWDVSLDLQRILKSGVITLMAGARRRIGFPRGEAKELNRLFQTESISGAGQTSKMERYLAFGRHLGLDVPPMLDSGLGTVPPLQSLVGAHAPILALVLGSSRPVKDWPVPREVDLVRLVLAQTPAHVVLLGGERRRHEASTILQETDTSRVIDLVGRTTLPELAGALRAASVATGPDSGPGHLAAALGTPYVALFGPTDPIRVAPHGCEDLAVVSPTLCDRCSRRRCRRAPGESCMAGITAQSVMAHLEPWLLPEASAPTR